MLFKFKLFEKLYYCVYNYLISLQEHITGNWFSSMNDISYQYKR